MKSIANGLNRTLYKEEDVGDRKRVVVEYIVTHIRVSYSFLKKHFLHFRKRVVVEYLLTHIRVS